MDSSERRALTPQRRYWTAIVLSVAVVVGPGAQQPTEIIIRHGLLVTAVGRTESDLRIRNGSIAEIGQNLPALAGAREIEAKGLLVIPGGIDPHTHLMERPGSKGDDDSRRHLAPRWRAAPRPLATSFLRSPAKR